MIEIGVQRPEQSIGLWLEYFPHAFVLGLDYGTPEEESERHAVRRCDQAALDTCQPTMDAALPPSDAYPLRFIIDDGSHDPLHQLT